MYVKLYLPLGIERRNMKTREKILNSMYKLVSIHGYDKTTISMICKDLSINKPSIYYCFSSKEDIFLTVFKEMICDIESHDIIDYFNNSNYKNGLLEAGYDFINEYENDNIASKVIFEFYVQSNRIESVNNLLTEYQRISMKLTKDLLTYGIENKHLSPDFDLKLNSQIIGSILYGIEMSYIFNIPQDNKKIWKTIIDRMVESYEKWFR